LEETGRGPSGPRKGTEEAKEKRLEP